MKPANMASVPSAVSGGAPPAKTVRFRINDRYIAPILITCILLAGQASFHILESYTQTLLAIVTAMAMEMVLGRLFTGKWPMLASAYITGISVGILVRSPYLWPYALCSAIAITSKYVIRFRNRHLWNPSNLGIVCLILLAPAYAATLSVQFGNSLWAMFVVWILGSIIIYRLKRFHICVTYALSFVGFAFLRSAILHDNWRAEMAPITGPMYQLFIFFMITDPKTTVKSKLGQTVVAFLVAAMENVLRLWGGFDSSYWTVQIASHAPYFALTIVGPIAMLVEIFRTAPATKPVPGVPPTGAPIEPRSQI